MHLSFLSTACSYPVFIPRLELLSACLLSFLCGRDVRAPRWNTGRPGFRGGLAHHFTDTHPKKQTRNKLPSFIPKTDPFSCSPSKPWNFLTIKSWQEFAENNKNCTRFFTFHKLLVQITSTILKPNVRIWTNIEFFIPEQIILIILFFFLLQDVRTRSTTAQYPTSPWHPSRSGVPKASTVVYRRPISWRWDSRIWPDCSGSSSRRNWCRQP